MDNLVFLSNVRAASNPTFIPGDNANTHRCLLTVIKNRKARDGRDLREEFSLVFWGKYAQTAALYIEKGRALNIEGAIRSYLVDTGRVKANGKPEVYRLNPIHVRSFEFGADSMKNLTARLNENIQRAKAEGLMAPNTTITAEYLLKTTPKQWMDFNPEMARQTGTYGNAKVFFKGQGFVNGTAQATAAANQAPTAQTTDIAAQIAQLQAQLSAMAGQSVNAQADNGAVSPF